jgi:hypothetical protein
LRLTREGKLPCKRFGRSVRFALYEIDALASRNSVPTT